MWEGKRGLKIRVYKMLVGCAVCPCLLVVAFAVVVLAMIAPLVFFLFPERCKLPERDSIYSRQPVEMETKNV